MYMRRFTLLNERQQVVAKILFFFEQPINQHVGIILDPTLSKYEQWLYPNDTDVDGIIRDLSDRMGIPYHSFVECFNP